MTQRLIAFALIILIALIALSASEHRTANDDLPLVDNARGGQVHGAQAVTDPGGVRALRVAPCVTIEPEEPPAGDDA